MPEPRRGQAAARGDRSRQSPAGDAQPPRAAGAPSPLPGRLLGSPRRANSAAAAPLPSLVCWGQGRVAAVVHDQGAPRLPRPGTGQGPGRDPATPGHRDTEPSTARKVSPHRATYEPAAWLPAQKKTGQDFFFFCVTTNLPARSNS